MTKPEHPANGTTNNFPSLTRFWFTLIALLTCFSGWGIPTGPAAQDQAELMKQSGWYIFNGSMELGEVGQRVPGYSIRAYFEPKTVAANSSGNYFPITVEENGNKFLLMKGIPGLPELNIYANKFFLEKDGIVEVSFNARIVPDEKGQFQPKQPVMLDFRCRNQNLEYGTVKERYPILFGRSFQPDAEWKTFTYRIKVMKGFDYSLWFRQYADNVNGHLNGLCLDDLSVRYVDREQAEKPDEIALIPDRIMSFYYTREKPDFTIRAELASREDNEIVELEIREDYSHRILEKRNVRLKFIARLTASTSLYSGRLVVEQERFGSYSMLCRRNGRLIFSNGGDFVRLHKLPREASPLQRKIGGHFRPHGYFQLIADNVAPALIKVGLESHVQVYAASGLRHAMYAFDLKKVQAEVDKLDFTLSDAEINLLGKYHIETIGCLGGWWIYQDRREHKGKKYGQLPDWLFDKKYTCKRQSGKGKQIPSQKEWTFHVNGVVDKYNTIIRKWMVLVEPQWVLKAEEYFELQKTAYEKVKSSNPQAYFIAGDGTSDVGYNLTGWLVKLNKLGFEKYLDAVSFNPYRSDCDYINGIRFRNSDLISRIRQVLKPGTALWEQELYYIGNSKRKQYPGARDVFTAGDAQRHYLLGFINGLEGITGINGNNGAPLFKTPYAPSDVCAGLNAMSFFMSDRSEFEAIKSSNKLVRTGLFYDKKKNNCAGFIWALQPNGASMKPFTSSFRLFDNFGNEMKFGAEIELGLDPVFVTGPYDVLKKLLSQSIYSMGTPVKIRSRKFGNTTYYEAQNLSGTDNIVYASSDHVPEAYPAMRLKYQGHDYQRFSITSDESVKAFKVGIVAEAGTHEICPVEAIRHSGELVIPSGAQKPLALSSEDGNRLFLWTANGKLWIKAEVIDKHITAAENDLYSGDALEVFIDRTPFVRLDLDENAKGSDVLEVRQYVFAPRPSDTGKKLMVMNKCNSSDITNTGARSESKDSPSGYTLLASIPLDEITPRSDGGNVIGMNFELCRKDGKENLKKDFFNKSTRPSWKYRRHYYLAALQGVSGNRLKNHSFENGISPWYCPQNNTLKTKNTFIVDDAYRGHKALKVVVAEKPSWSSTLNRVGLTYERLNLEQGDYILSFFAKGNHIDQFKISLKGNKAVILSKKQAPVKTHWTHYEIPMQVKTPQSDGHLYIEVLSPREDEGAYFIMDDVCLMKR